MKKIVALFAFCIFLIGCKGSSEPSVNIETYDKTNQLFGIKYVEVVVTAIKDDLVIKDIIVNRGNCKIENVNIMNGKPILPKTLKFGETVSVTFAGPCRAAQVDVETSKGGWSVSY